MHAKMTLKHTGSASVNQICCAVTSFRYSRGVRYQESEVGEVLGGIKTLLLKAESVSPFTQKQQSSGWVTNSNPFGQLRSSGLKQDMDTHVKRGEVYLQHQKYSEVRHKTLLCEFGLLYISTLITF